MKIFAPHSVARLGVASTAECGKETTCDLQQRFPVFLKVLTILRAELWLLFLLAVKPGAAFCRRCAFLKPTNLTRTGFANTERPDGINKVRLPSMCLAGS